MVTLDDHFVDHLYSKEKMMIWTIESQWQWSTCKQYDQEKKLSQQHKEDDERMMQPILEEEEKGCTNVANLVKWRNQMNRAMVPGLPSGKDSHNVVVAGLQKLTQMQEEVQNH